jgi:hypothetical protein
MVARGGAVDEEGWYVDPFGRHEARWISDAVPTALVRDGRIESHDPPPDTVYPGTLQPVPEESRADGTDLRRADEAETTGPRPDVWSVVDPYGGTG